MSKHIHAIRTKTDKICITCGEAVAPTNTSEEALRKKIANHPFKTMREVAVPDSKYIQWYLGEKGADDLMELIKAYGNECRANENQYWLGIYEGVYKDYIDVNVVKENHQNRLVELQPQSPEKE